jgi:hypothetical protein
MHQTTLRFSEDLWDLIAVEARRLNVSVAQYVREAALTRVAYDAGRRGDRLFEAALRRAGAAPAELRQADVASEDRAQASRLYWAKAELAREPSEDPVSRERPARGDEG